MALLCRKPTMREDELDGMPLLTGMAVGVTWDSYLRR
jgi:hypothetical protein